MSHTQWPDANKLHQITKNRFALYSQSVQQVTRAFLANIETTRELRKTHPQMRMKYPWRTKRFYPVRWPAQAVSKEKGRVILPMGKGRKSIVLPVELPENSGACTLVWNNGFELHVCIGAPQAKDAPGEKQATVDLGEIHLAAVTTNTGQALIVTGRGIRSLKVYGSQVMFPRSFTYLRPGLSRRSRRADTPPCCLSESAGQPRISDTVSSETGHTAHVAQKPVSL
jgi:putative transposase